MRLLEFTAIAISLCLLACQEDKAPSTPATGPADGTPAAAPPALPAPDPHKAPAGHAPTAGELGPEAAGGLTWKAAAPLTRRAPKSRMRAAEYAVPGGAPDTSGELTVYYFGPGQGGSVDANLDRWIGQFRAPDGSAADRSAAKIDKREVNGLQVTTLDLTGTFVPSMGPMMQAKPEAARAQHRVLGAIAVGPEGPVFFKLVGPAATVASAEPAFAALVDSLQPK